jgi:hypothetical protein
MTFHLVGPYLTTNNTKKRKTKSATKSDLQAAWLEHNKWLKSHNMPKLSYDEFLEYKSGRKITTLSKSVQGSVKALTPKSTISYPSLNSKVDSNACAKREENVYTGDKLLGIAVIHKSCLQPVFSKEDAIEISRMRRG